MDCNHTRFLCLELGLNGRNDMESHLNDSWDDTKNIFLITTTGNAQPKKKTKQKKGKKRFTQTQNKHKKKTQYKQHQFKSNQTQSNTIKSNQIKSLLSYFSLRPSSTCKSDRSVSISS